MNAAEVVISEMQTVRSPEILPLLAKAVRETGEPSHLHSKGQVLPFDMAGANLCRIGISHDWDSLRVRDIGRTVPALAFKVRDIDLDELSEVAAVGKRSGD